MATTRLQLLKDICSELGDRVELTASTDGSTSAFVSEDDMMYADGGLNGGEVWYVSSADPISASNVGKRRVIISTTFDDSTIQVYPEWPAISQAGDVVLITNVGGTSVRIPEIHDKINQLIRRVSLELATEVASTEATFNARTPTIEIPDEWDYLLGVQVAEWGTTDAWTTVVGDVFQVSSWDTPKTVTIFPHKRTLLGARSVRLIGSIELQPLDEDDDETTAPAGWLAKTAAFELLEAAASRSGDVATALTYGEMLKQQATELRAYVGRRYRPTGKRIALRR